VKIVYPMLWQNWNRERDAQTFVDDEMYLAELAEDLGYDAVSSVEHHFDPEYSACPDQFLMLANLAARTKTIKLVTGACILPWNDPLRVVEKYALLDRLAPGRIQVGFGRGLARIEYDGFDIPMDESRERFDEAAEMVLRGIRTGKVSGTGKYYPQPEVEVHPAPRPELADDLLSVAMSGDSAVAAGELGAALLAFTTKSPEGMLPLIQGYRDAYLKATGTVAPPEQLHDFSYLSPNQRDFEEKGAVYLGRYYQEVVRHYSFDGTHFAKTKGYTAYAASAQEIRDEGMDEATRKYVEVQTMSGTPEQVIEKFRQRSEVLGKVDIGVPAYFGGMTRDEAVRSMQLFAKEVMPEIRRIDATLPERELASA